MTLMHTIANDRINLKPVGPKNAVPTGTGLITLTASFTRPGNTTAYAAGQLIANDTAAGNVTPLVFDASDYLEKAVSLTVNAMRVRIPGQTTTITTGLILYLFNAQPVTSVGDGGALLSGGNLATTGAAGFMGATAAATGLAVLTDGLVALTTSATTPITLAQTSSTIYGLLSAAGGWTPSAASQLINVELLLRP
jgi:hypothetical protein